MTDIIEALAEIQSQLHAPKNQRNDFGKYNYRKAEDIIAAFKALELGNETLTLSDEIVAVGDRIFLKATATLSVGGQSVSVDGWAMHAMQKKGMDDAQITGSCSSYARKHALCGLFAIDDSEQDPDSKRPTEEPKQPPKSSAPGIYKRPENATLATAFSALISAVESCNTQTSLNNLLGNQSFDEDWTKLEGHSADKANEIRKAVDAKRNSLGE